jgi:hypothetical protein
MNLNIPKNHVSMVIFLYLMIYLWLWIVPTYQCSNNMELLNYLTQPFDPMQSNNDSDTLLDSLLFTAKNKWDIDEEQIMENMNKIAFHESKGVSNAIQQSDKTESGIGPGRGLFQFEKGEGQGANTAINRLISEIGYTPKFLEGIGEGGYDISSLSPEQQQIIFLGNLLQMPQKEGEGYLASSFEGIDTDEELAEYWAQHHQAGTKPGTDEYEDMLTKFIEDVQFYK